MNDKEGKNEISKKEDAISVGGYFLRDFIYRLPIIGLIAALIAACGDDNPHAKNHARARLLRLLIGVLALVGCLVFYFATSFK